MARILISAAVILLVAGMFLATRPMFQRTKNAQNLSPDQIANSATDSTDSAQNLSLPSRTKYRDRIVHRKPTLEETVDLLRSTIIPRVDIEDLSVGESANRIRLMIQDAGIEPHELRIVCDMTAPISEMRITELRFRNIPLAVLLRYMCGRTKLVYRVTPGVLEFHSMSEDPFEGDYDANDPFAEPGPATPILEPADPFSGTRNEESDPFAEP